MIQRLFITFPLQMSEHTFLLFMPIAQECTNSDYLRLHM